MISSKYSIAMAAVLFAAAFAGVAIIADDASATDDTPAAGAVTYKVTYVYGDNVRVVTSTSATVKFLLFDEAFSTPAPEGYVFDKWKVGSSLYAAGSTIEVTGDIAVEPTFKADRAIVRLVYGDKVLEVFDEKSAIASNIASKTPPSSDSTPEDVPYTAQPKDLKNFAELIGATAKITIVKLVSESGSESESELVVGFDLPGYKFNGFVKAGTTTPIIPLDGLTSTAKIKAEENTSETTSDSKSYKWVLDKADITSYEAVFEPVYDITFMVEGAQVGNVSTEDIDVNSYGTKGILGLPTAPVKENYIFIGWFDAEGSKVIGYSVDKKEYTFVEGKDFKFAADTTLYAHFVPLTYTVTFVYGEDKAVFTTETVKYGEKAIEPKGLPDGYKGWDFDFAEAILSDTEIVAIPADPVTIYTVTFEIDGKAPVTQRSDSMVLPDTAIDGKVFQGWVVKGESQYVDPMKYDIKSDITFVAVYKTADPPAGPSFFETNTGKCVAVIIGVGIIALFYAVYTNMFGMKDFLTSFKVQRVKKE